MGFKFLFLIPRLHLEGNSRCKPYLLGITGYLVEMVYSTLDFLIILQELLYVSKGELPNSNFIIVMNIIAYIYSYHPIPNVG